MITLITCTYNPDPDLLARLCLALERCVSAYAGACEYCLVDNNSTPPLSSRPEVCEFLEKHSWARLIVEARPGLAHARCAGIRAARGEWFVFFDDDNEPALDYLNTLYLLTAEVPDLGCVGAGSIEVEFPECTSLVVKRYAIDFQKREISKPVFYSKWDECEYILYGTGLCVRRGVALSYLEKVDATEYSMTDRTRSSLASGSDLQIVFEALRLKMRVGVSPALRINHLVGRNKSTFFYLVRLRFGCAVSYHPALRQVFPDAKPDLVPSSNRDVIRFIWWHFVLFGKGRLTFSDFVMKCVERLGQIESQTLGYDEERRPLVVRILLFLLRLG